MQRLWILYVAMVIMGGCKDKKKSLSGNERVEAEEFFSAFRALKLPFNAADTSLQKVADTTTISYTVISQFIPDSALSKNVRNVAKDKFVAVGKIEKGDEKYILINTVENKTSFLNTFLFDKNYVFLSSLPLISNKSGDGYIHSISVNNEPTFILSREKTTNDNKYLYTRNGFAYNKEAKGFITVVNESNEDKKKLSEVINPIDTFPKKNKFSGDYVENKQNFISLRDGKDANNYLFFVHFEKNKGECIGELKGDMKMISADKAVFEDKGDPCVIDFAFVKNNIKVKERGSCGTHRGIKCFFNDRYTKKKERKSKASTKKKTG